MYEHNLNNAFSRIKADDELKDRIKERIEEREMNKTIVKRTRRAAMVAACAAVIGISTAFAASPAGQEAISSIVAYFRSDKATEMTDIKELSKYNEEIGKSISKDGYTMTLDNVAADDNFIHVFYTLKSEKPFYEGEEIGIATENQLWVDCVLNSQLAGYYSNHNSLDGYFDDPYTYHAAMKYNISTLNIPDRFKVELIAYESNMVKDNDPLIETLYVGDSVELTDDEKARVLYICADIDKSSVKVESCTKEINTKLPWSGATVEKAIFSPFGNQLVLTTEATGNSDLSVSNLTGFALFDENGVCLDVLNTDLRANNDGSSRNSFEFLKADKNTKQLKFVPVKFLPKNGDSEVISQKTGTYPMTYQVSDYGKLVVTDIRISDGRIAIDYYIDGFILYNPGFLLMNDNGENAEPGGKLGCTLYTNVHYDTNSYTALYKYEAWDKSGKPIPADESVSAENLRKNFTTLGVIKDDYIELDYDKSVTVNLK